MNLPKLCPSVGLQKRYDPDARPIREFMPPDEREEWNQYVTYLEGKNENFYGNTMKNEVYIHDYDEPAPIPEKPTTVQHVKVFKIRHKKTGKFSGGGSFVYWSDKGKEWKTLGGVNNHLAANSKGGVCYGHNYGGPQNQTKLEDVEVVTYQRTITTVESKADSAPEQVKGILERRAKRSAKEAENLAKYKLVQAQQELLFAQEKLNKLKG
jgi:hypothetical protein